VELRQYVQRYQDAHHPPKCPAQTEHSWSGAQQGHHNSAEDLLRIVARLIVSRICSFLAVMRLPKHLASVSTCSQNPSSHIISKSLAQQRLDKVHTLRCGSTAVCSLFSCRNQLLLQVRSDGMLHKSSSWTMARLHLSLQLRRMRGLGQNSNLADSGQQ
jgi:hypothetical protein